MADFDDDFAAADDAFDDVFGTEKIIVTETDGTEHEFNGTVLDEQVEHRETDLGRETVVTRQVDIPISTAGREEDGQPEVLNLRGTVTINDLVYAIESITHGRIGRATLHCKRTAPSERGRDTYRRRRT